VVINTLNEAANIAACVESVRGFASEVVVCDMRSSDGTPDLARELGARVETVDAAFCDFGRLRHFAVLQARHEWVLVIDADERLTPALGRRLHEEVARGDVDVVRFGNLFWYFGGWVRHGGFYADNWIRFFRRDAYLERYSEQDEMVHDDLSVLKGVARQTTLPPGHHLEHYAYPSIEKYVSKTVGMYARVEAEQLARSGRRFSFARLLGEPVKVFLVRFVKLRGYRDGTRGFILAMLFAAYRFTTWANVWMLEEAERPQPAASPETARVA
jgi:(heptosyl)LPS beta-1,4-glucosyltransferase